MAINKIKVEDVKIGKHFVFDDKMCIRILSGRGEESIGDYVIFIYVSDALCSQHIFKDREVFV